MSIENERLVSIIEYAQQSARLRTNPVSTIAQHKLFSLYEHELKDLPGIQLNHDSSESEDEIWFSIERISEKNPPDITDLILLPWVRLSRDPSVEPELLKAIAKSELDEKNAKKSGQTTNLFDTDENETILKQDDIIKLQDYDRATKVKDLFDIYMNSKWRPWSAAEKLRRKTIRLYSELFMLKQQLEGDISDSQIELLWGVGIGIWKYHDKEEVRYPLIGRLVELDLDSETAELLIRPRDLDASLEIDWYAANNNPGVTQFEKEAKEFFSLATSTFSPFDRNTFEKLLLSAVTHLGGNGVYWPNHISADDRSLPKSDNKLKVTDTWVLFARPRTNNLFIQDLERLRKAAEVIQDPKDYPPAIAAIVTDPDTDNTAIELPSFRGVSASYQNDNVAPSNNRKPRDLYFPKPFNDEQVRIIQLLDISDGVVVQGPPGTGKTHTIANVICHYLAEGKRVLVTSYKDPALAVLHEQLPVEIRPLAISLLTSEQEGMKQFEYAIYKIASEIQNLDRTNTEHEINGLENTIDVLHSKLADIDFKVGEWAKLNLMKISIDNEDIEPQDAALEVVDNINEFEWIPDAIKIDAKYKPQFTDADIIALRDARRVLGQDIDYLESSLPKLNEFPDLKTLLTVHHDLSKFEILKQAVENGNVPALANSDQKILANAQQLVLHITDLREKRDEIMKANRSWTKSIKHSIKNAENNDVFIMMERLGTELLESDDKRKAFLMRPVIIPNNADKDVHFIEAVSNLANGKNAFGLKGIFGKAIQKRWIESIRILGNIPKRIDDWIHIKNYLDLQHRLRELAMCWNEFAREFGLDIVGDSPNDAIKAAQDYAIYLKVKKIVEEEKKLCVVAKQVFPDWIGVNEVAENDQKLDELYKALQHHLTKNRLANVWAIKERFHKILAGRSGHIINDIRHFLEDKLGNTKVDDTQMQVEWSAMMAELVRVSDLRIHLDTVNVICKTIKNSGAPKYAEALSKPINGITDTLLPDNWRKAWRLKRLWTYLESIDGHQELKDLSRNRYELTDDLSHTYNDIILKRTWLKLAENASPSIRSALQAYLNAVKKMGTGKGKRAVRFRKDARDAASRANPAVPCWIMPHYRVSETLPPELGCFDLVIIDEASQSDLSALPALLRAKKVLIVGDDKQVSPEGVGLEEEKIRTLMNRFLGNQVVTYGAQMSPERSMYDLFKVVFAKNTVMLKEHFRCVRPIIEYSKREFYNHELRPLRLPKATERIDPPLIDVLITDGYRRGDINLPETRFIVDEIKTIVNDPNMGKRTIGVVSLLADYQAREVNTKLITEIGPEYINKHKIHCGDARSFQGKQRDIMFLSMVSAPNNIGAPLSRDTFAQRFNVAASRARDRMYLVRSVNIEHLSDADYLRRGLITHFATPFIQDEIRVEDYRKLCESSFERDMYDELTQLGYWVTPQVQVGHYRIDMVVEGHDDARLAIECDGDKYHGAEKWADDQHRQRVLERAGWIFWRCFASAFIRRRKEVMEDLLKTLSEHGIEPIGSEGAPRSIHTEHRIVTSIPVEEYLIDPEISEDIDNPQSQQIFSIFNDIDNDVADVIQDDIVSQFESDNIIDKDYTKHSSGNDVVDYICYSISGDYTQSDNIRDWEDPSDAIIQIVNGESPIHIEHMILRLASLHGVDDIETEMFDFVSASIEYQLTSRLIKIEGDFLLPNKPINISIRRPSIGEPMSFRSFDWICDKEIIAAYKLLDDLHVRKDSQCLEYLRNLYMVPIPDTIVEERLILLLKAARKA